MKRLVILITLFFIAAGIYAQQTITGIVKNQNGEALIGANVVIKGTFKGTATNSEGKFEFTKVKPNTYVFSISYLGYNTLEKKVDVKEGRKKLN